MADNSGWSSTNVLLPGAIALALAITSYLTYEPTLTSVRPTAPRVPAIPPPPPLDGMHSFYSRLWEDPLLTSYSDDASAKGDSSAKGDAKPQPTYTRGPVPLNEGRNAAYKETFGKILKVPQLLCMPVLVPGGPYADDSETRMRMRYAIQMALARSGYELTFPMQMSYVDVPVTVNLDDVDTHLCVKQFRVPVKFFRIRKELKKEEKGSDQPSYVVLLWINEDESGSRLLSVIDQVIGALFRPKTLSASVSARATDDAKWRPKLSVRVIGPASSDGLRKLYGERARQRSSSAKTAIPLAGFRDVKIYSPRATVPERELNQLVAADLASQQDPQKKEVQADATAKDSTTDFPEIIRTIGDDNVLVAALTAEMGRRGRWRPAPKNGEQQGAVTTESEDAPASDPHGKAIALVAEQDTLYGRIFPRMLKDKCPDDSLHLYSFFRGVDGAIPGDRAPNVESEIRSLLERSKQPSTTQDGDNEPRPTGKGQADYLRRLESELIALDGQEQRNGYGGISAIGVVSTDQFDKLLFLRALRRRFPGTVFFTTDLDAEFAHPSERLTTRNVVVASHFGLHLGPMLQGEVPPFRDCYQTSTFFAALLALGPRAVESMPEAVKRNPWGKEGQGDSAECLRPLIFEIGLDGPYQLTIPKGPYASDGHSQVQPDSPRNSSLPWWQLVWSVPAILSLGACLIVSFTWPRRMMTAGHLESPGRFLIALGQRTALFLALTTIPLAIALVDHHRLNGEPLSWNRGISLWPTTLIQYLAGVTAVVLFLSSRADLKKLGERFRTWSNPTLTEQTKLKTFGKAFRGKSWRRRAKYFWRHVLTFNWHAQATDETYSAHALSAEYVERSQWWHRVLRIVPQVVMFFAFSSCLFQIAVLPSRPYRGELSNVASSIAIIFAALSLVVLSFYVIDAMQLCRRYIRLLERAASDWENDELSKLLKFRGMDSNKAEEQSAEGREKLIAAKQLTRKLFTVHVIADTSHVVGKLILYPFIVVFLLFIARSPVFDYLTLGAGLITIWLLLLAGALIASISMRVTAAHTRDAILAQLRNELAGCSDTRQCDMIKQTIQDITDERQGAFRHWSSDPVFGALVILLGGGGSLVAIEQLLPWMLM